MASRAVLRTSAPAARWPPWYRSGMTRPAMVVLACLLPSCALFGDLGPIRDKSMSDVAALEGCWVGLLGLATVEECWGRPASGTMPRSQVRPSPSRWSAMCKARTCSSGAVAAT